MPTNVLIDTGASCSIIDIGSVHKLGLADQINPHGDLLVNASGNPMDILGSVDINIDMQDFTVVQNLKVLNHKTFRNVLLGRDFLTKFKNVEFDFVNNKVRIGRSWHLCKDVKGKEPVRLQKRVSLVARSESVVAVKCNKSLSLVTADFEPISLFGTPGVYATRCRVVPDLEGVFQITFLNVNDTEVHLKSRKCVGNLTGVENVMSCKVKPLGKDSTNAAKSTVFGENLSNDQRHQLEKLINEYQDVFASNPKKPSLVKNAQHKIITEDAMPVKHKTRRIPEAWHEEVNRQVQEMLDNHVIRPSSSPWNAPIILVKKKDNSMRFVCDFRGLNNVTKKDSYPLPHIRDVIDKMSGAVYWTTLDAASAYWSIPLAEHDREKTAFSVPRGKFEFNVTPYGLCNAGATYQRMIDIALSGLPGDRILAYMDDMVVFSKSFSEHLEDLQQIFRRLRYSSISLKLSKCVFASERVDFLGFTLSAAGIQPQARLTEAIKQYQPPANKKQLKGFLGLAGFYRSFIPKFADISKPLNALTNHDTPFFWSKDCQNAFQDLKYALTSEPVLMFPNFSQSFIVEVDASNYAVGGVLSQLGLDHREHPVAYFSTALQKSQQNWSVTTKESFALVLAVRHWHVYLAGRNFLLKTDHNPLVFLRSQKDPRGKLSRWINELEEFDYTIKYVPGKENVKADALSRNNAADPDQPTSTFEDKIYASFIKSKGFLEQLATEQLRDPVIKNAKLKVGNNESITQGRLKRVQKQLRIEKDVLTKSGRPIIPPSLRKLIVAEYHDKTHFGTRKVYSLLQQRFYWPNMFGYIQSFTSNCRICQQSKCDTMPPKAPMVPMFTPSAPMQLISLDIGYMPKDGSGYQYMLLIGDTFSKYVHAISLKDQTAPTIVNALLHNWVYIHGTPLYLLTDQGSNVDGALMKQICNLLGIEKRRSSAYHSQGNGFAERNIRTVKDMFRAVLLQRRLPQSRWRSILPELVFALNASISKATKCVPYEVVFGRSVILPQDIMFEVVNIDQHDQSTAANYEQDLRSTLQDTFHQVVKTLQLSKQIMQKHYNRNVRFHTYKTGQNVWLKVKHYKTGENRKLAPRRDGPWTIVQKLPNGVNFEIENHRGERKIVHHDRLSPVVGDEVPRKSSIQSYQQSSDTSSCDASEDSSDESYSTCSTASARESIEERDRGNMEERDRDNNEDILPDRGRPQRARTIRQIPGTIPWDALDI